MTSDKQNRGSITEWPQAERNQSPALGKHIRAIFFDAGNTLLYPKLDGLLEELSRRGFRVSAEDFYAAERAGKLELEEWLWPQIHARRVAPGTDRYYWGLYLDKFLDRIGAVAESRPELKRALREGFSDIRIWSQVLPGTAEVLARLQNQGFRLGVISNSIGTVEQQLDRAGLRSHFEFVLDSAVVGVEKPDPKIFQMAVERAGIRPDEAVFVGDTYATDIGGAEWAGLGGVLVDRVGAYPKAICARAELLVEIDFSEMSS